MGIGGLAQPVSCATSADTQIVLEKSPEAWQVRGTKGRGSWHLSSLIQYPYGPPGLQSDTEPRLRASDGYGVTARLSQPVRCMTSGKASVFSELQFLICKVGIRLCRMLRQEMISSFQTA